ncbi:MAG: hypothetical protein IT379_08380 [Deltaproteobacteria bacterium]|nr:hypothetical protein [Deltaproteobacteria bacterium]
MRDRFSLSLLGVVLSCGAWAASGCGDNTTARPPTTVPVGSGCGGGVLCDDGLSCVNDGRLPGGYCSRICTDATCPDGSTCTMLYGSPLCLAGCGDGRPCRDGYQCWRGVCRGACGDEGDCGGGSCTDGTCTGPECTTAADCAGDGATCEAGRCVTPPPPPPDDAGPPPIPPPADAGPPGAKADGEACTQSSECMSLVCLPPERGGTCATACTDRAACEALSFDLTCIPVDVDGNSDGVVEAVRTGCTRGDVSRRLAGQACATDDDCISRACFNAFCTEPCDDPGDCIAGLVCAPTLRPSGVAWNTCTFPGATPGTFDIPITTADIGAGSTGPRIEVAAVPGAASITLIAETIGGDPLPLSFNQVFAPDESSIFDYASLIGRWEDQPIRWVPDASGGVIAMLVPNTTPDRWAFQAGRYSWSIFAAPRAEGDTGTTSVRFSARVRYTAGADITTGTVGLNVWLVGVGLDPASAPSDFVLSTALGYVAEIYGAVGIAVEVAQYLEVPAEIARRYSVIDSSGDADSELAQLFGLSAGQTNQAVNVFLVRGFAEGAGEGGGFTLGIAGGIPGPPSIHGTAHSGVAVSFDSGVVGSGDQAAAIVAQIMSHEIGHYLGLYHVQEQGSACPGGTGPTEADPCSPWGGTDPLTDTPTGRSSGSNLMYFALGGSDGRTFNVDLSGGQGFVMRRHAVVR